MSAMCSELDRRDGHSQGSEEPEKRAEEAKVEEGPGEGARLLGGEIVRRVGRKLFLHRRPAEGEVPERFTWAGGDGVGFERVRGGIRGRRGRDGRVGSGSQEL